MELIEVSVAFRRVNLKRVYIVLHCRRYRAAIIAAAFWCRLNEVLPCMHLQRVTNTGLVNVDTNADVSAVETIPDTKQRWDKNYSGPGVTGPAAKGPAVQGLVRKRSGS